MSEPPTHLSPWTLTMPVAMGYVPLGTVFGFLFVQAGGAWWLAVASSLIVYAGAAQYMMVPMLAAGLPISTVALATLVINLRHVFYGLSLLKRFPRHGLVRWYLMFGLTDETYSVLTTLPEHTPIATMLQVTAINQSWWVLGTLLGAVIGAQAQVPLVGLDFVLASLFAVLAVEQWRARAHDWPLWLALGSYGVAVLTLPAQALSIGMGACVAFGVLISQRKKPEQQGAA